MRPLLIIAIVLPALLSSCRIYQQPIVVSSQDSVRVEIRDRFVAVRDTVYREMPRQEAERTVRDSVSHLENDYAESDAQVYADGTLRHSLTLKARTDTLPTFREVVVKDSIIYREKEITTTVEVERELTPWQRFRLRLGDAVLAVIAAIILWAILRLYLRK